MTLVHTPFKFLKFNTSTGLKYKECCMKKIYFIILFIFTVNSLLAQEKFSEFQAGVLLPSDAETGFIGGITIGRMVDESVGWGIELDFYRKTYTKESKVPQVPQGQVDPVLVLTEIENSTTMLPVYFKLLVHTQIAPKLDLRIGGGVGYEFMWNSVTNYTKGLDDTRFYSGFTWQVGGGIAFPLSRASDVFIDVSYHGGSPSRGESKNELGLPVYTEVNMSGLMIRGGIRLYTFGFF